MLDLDTIESIEKATLRSVVQAMYDFRGEAAFIFANGHDLPGDMGEDATREALDNMGLARVPSKRLFGKIDYKKARYVFLPQFALKQALFVDSKAEKDARTATIQMSQTSMHIHQHRGGKVIHEKGVLPTTIDKGVDSLLVTTVFVKYDYQDPQKDVVSLGKIFVICIPNGLLQERYNPDPDDTIWLVGRNAPKRGEDFRVRVSMSKLKTKAKWRVQEIDPKANNFCWDE